MPHTTSTSSSTLAGPPGDCCFTGVKHSGIPAGQTISIANVPTYISNPPNTIASADPKKIILFLADVYGPFFLNNQLLQDYFAEQGFIVLGMDYFFGDPVYIHTEDGFDRQAWMEKSTKQAHEAFPRWLKEVKAVYGLYEHYCAVGYCFGAPFALDLATRSDTTAAAFAHPAFLDESHISDVTQPLLMSCAETDSTFPLPARRRAEDILIAAGATYHIQVFSGVTHGFAVRGDPNNETHRWAKNESARGIATWFNRFVALRHNVS